jgi:hypothetical protein
MREQLARRPEGAARVGWKYGSGDDEHLGGDHVVGHLTSATTLADGGTYTGGGGELQADVELAVEIGEGRTPSAYAVALEICDLARSGTVEELAADNDLHCAVTFGPFADALPSDLEGVVVVNGERRAAARARADLEGRIAAVDRVLASVGEQLEPGDRLITGFIVNAPVRPGDAVAAELGELGRVELSIA